MSGTFFGTVAAQMVVMVSATRRKEEEEEGERKGRGGKERMAERGLTGKEAREARVRDRPVTLANLRVASHRKFSRNSKPPAATATATERGEGQAHGERSQGRIAAWPVAKRVTHPLTQPPFHSIPLAPPVHSHDDYSLSQLSTL